MHEMVLLGWNTNCLFALDEEIASSYPQIISTAKRFNFLFLYDTPCVFFEMGLGTVIRMCEHQGLVNLDVG